MSDFRIEQVAIGKLKPAKRNARTHSKKQIHQIAASITEFGFTNPVLVDRRDQILAGHGRFEAAKLLGLPNVPVIRLEHLTEQQKRAYAIADNKLALNAGWDLDILAADLKELSELELPFDMEITGFATAEIDQLLDGPSKPVKNDPLDSVPPVSATAVARLNDVWILGDHKLLCADAREPGSYEALLGDEEARMVFADPPYNVPIDGHVGGPGSREASRVCHGFGKDERAPVHGFLGGDISKHGRGECGWGNPLHLHGLASHW